MFNVIIGLMGLLFGSFLNVIIARLPRAILADAHGPSSIVTPRSQCPHCESTISARDNIPVLSFIWLRGRCRNCQNPISLRYPCVELLSGLCAFLIAHKFGTTPATFAYILFTLGLITLSFIDLEHMILPDDITQLLLWTGLLYSVFFADSNSAIVGAVLGYATLWLVYWLFKWITGREGLGFGDFKLNAALGAWLGWQALPFVIFFASFLGVIVGMSIVVKRGRNTPIPFGPFLAIAGFTALMIDFNQVFSCLSLD